MVEYRRGDVLNSGELIVVHGCNCFNTMGAGLAKQVRAQYPEAWQADQLTIPGDRSKLGTYTQAQGRNGTIIINAYPQYTYSRAYVTGDYNAIESALRAVCIAYESHNVIATPTIGAGLAGGDWGTIETILTKISAKYNKTFRVYIRG